MRKKIRLSKDNIIVIDNNCIAASIYKSEALDSMMLAVYNKDYSRVNYKLKTNSPVETFEIFEDFRDSFRLIHDSMYIYDSRESILLMNENIENLKLDGNYLVVNEEMYLSLNEKFLQKEFDNISEIYTLYLDEIVNK